MLDFRSSCNGEFGSDVFLFVDCCECPLTNWWPCLSTFNKFEVVYMLIHGEIPIVCSFTNRRELKAKKRESVSQDQGYWQEINKSSRKVKIEVGIFLHVMKSCMPKEPFDTSMHLVMISRVLKNAIKLRSKDLMGCEGKIHYRRGLITNHCSGPSRRIAWIHYTRVTKQKITFKSPKTE